METTQNETEKNVKTKKMNRAVGQYQEALDICNCSPREEEMGDKKKKNL